MFDKRGHNAPMLVQKGDCQDYGYEVGMIVGAGSYCTVRVGHVTAMKPSTASLVDCVGHRNCAVKIINKRHCPREYYTKRLPHEIKALFRVRKHPHIVQFYESFSRTRYLYLIMEYCSGGTLLMHINRRVRLDEDESCRMFMQLCSAVKYCHRVGVVHRNIQCPSILLDSSTNIKLSDFGSARVLDKTTSHTVRRPMKASNSYGAPETIIQKTYDGLKSDIWSLGVVLFVMVNGVLPFDGSYTKRILLQRMARQIFDFASSVSLETRSLIRKILRWIPHHRPTLGDIMICPWMKDYAAEESRIVKRGPLATDETPTIAPVPASILKRRSHSATVRLGSNEDVLLKSKLPSKEWLRIMQEKDGGALVSQTLKVACALQFRDMPRRNSDIQPRSRAPSPIQEGSVTSSDSESEETSSTISNKVVADDAADAGDVGLPKADQDAIDKEAAEKFRATQRTGDRGDTCHPWARSTEGGTEQEAAGSRSPSKQPPDEAATPGTADTSSQLSSEFSSSVKSRDTGAQYPPGSSAELTRENVERLQKSLEASERQDLPREDSNDIQLKSLSKAVTYWKAVCREAPGCQAASKLTPQRRRSSRPQRTPAATTAMAADIRRLRFGTALMRSKSAPQPRAPNDSGRDAYRPLRVIELAPTLVDDGKTPRRRFTKNDSPGRYLPSRPLLRHSAVGVTPNVSEGVTDEYRLLSQEGLLNVLTLNHRDIIDKPATQPCPKPCVVGSSAVNVPSSPTKPVPVEETPRNVNMNTGMINESKFRNELTVTLPTVPCNSVMSDSLNDVFVPHPVSDASLEIMLRTRQPDNPTRESNNGKRARQSVSFDLNPLPKAKPLLTGREAKASLPCLRRATEDRAVGEGLFETSAVNGLNNTPSAQRRNVSVFERYDDAIRRRALAQLRVDTPAGRVPHLAPRVSPDGSATAEHVNTSPCKLSTDEHTKGQTHRLGRHHVGDARKSGSGECLPLAHSSYLTRGQQNVNTNNESLKCDNFSEAALEESLVLDGCTDLSVSQGQRWRNCGLMKTDFATTTKSRQRQHSESLDTTASLLGSSKTSVIDSFADDALLDHPPEVIVPKTIKLAAVPEQDKEPNNDNNKTILQPVESQKMTIPESTVIVKDDKYHVGQLVAIAEKGSQQLPFYMVLPNDKSMFRAIVKSAAATEAFMLRHCLQERPFQANVRDIIETFYELSAEMTRGNQTGRAIQAATTAPVSGQKRIPLEGRPESQAAYSTPLEAVSVRGQGLRPRNTVTSQTILGTFPHVPQGPGPDTTAGP